METKRNMLNQTGAVWSDPHLPFSHHIFFYPIHISAEGVSNNFDAKLLVYEPDPLFVGRILSRKMRKHSHVGPGTYRQL